MVVAIVSLLSFTACKKDNTESTKSLSDQKIEFQTRQLEIQKQQLAIEKEQMVYKQQKEADSIKNVEAKKAALVKSNPQPVQTKTIYVDNTPRNNSGSTSNSGTSNSGTSSSSAPVAQKKGWSSAAKGTVIGTVGGAAAGAIIAKKNKGLGAVIGGVVGGATGYTVGRANDRKTGRVQPK